MPIATTSQTLFDGNRRTVMQFTGVSDGSGQLINQLLVSAKSLNPKAAAVKVLKITGQVSFGLVQLWWDALTPVKFAELSGESINFDYTSHGPLNNRFVGAEETGDILITTSGFTGGSSYMLEIEMIKSYS